MKILKIFILTLIFLFSTNTIEAQFLKKLKKKAKQKIEREAERRAQRRVDKKIDKTFDEAENEIDGKTKPKKNSKLTNLPENYGFDWEYTMQMQYKKGNVNMIYYLKPEATYFAMKPEFDKKKGTMDMFIIMDIKREINISLMKIKDDKMMNVMSTPEELAENNDNQKFTIIKTNKKTILGYTCQGFKTESKDMIVNMYIAENAPVNFVFANNNAKNMPKGFNSKWLNEYKNGIMLEMEFIYKKKNKKKHNGKMICTSLIKKPFSIKISDYKSFGL